jgi:hypothetical protein
MDDLSAIAEQARAYRAAHGFNPHARLRITISDADSKEDICSFLAVATARPKAAEPPRLSAKQKKILAALSDGPLKGDDLAQTAGSENRTTLMGNRGMDELKAWGYVESTDEGYRLTESGENRAAEVIAD